jgi:hypothetical protein
VLFVNEQAREKIHDQVVGGIVRLVPLFERGIILPYPRCLPYYCTESEFRGSTRVAGGTRKKGVKSF